MLRGHYGLRRITAARPAVAPASARHVRLYSSTSSEPRDVAILGGGITGLASAYYLSQIIPSAKITIYEAGPRIGGWLLSKRVDVDDGTVLFEAGPRTLRPVGNGALGARLIHELGLSDETIFTSKKSPAALNRFIYYPDHIVRVPSPSPEVSLLSIVSTVLGEPAFKGAVWRMPLEGIWHPRDSSIKDESIGEFLSRRLSRDLVNRLISAVIHGIYAGDVWKLSAKSLFPTQWRDEGQQGSIMEGILKSTIDGPEMTTRERSFMEMMKSPYPFNKDFKENYRSASVYTFRHGLNQLIDALVEKLRSTGNVTFTTNAPAMGISTAEDGNINLEFKENTTENSVASHTHVISTLGPGKLGSMAITPSRSSLPWNPSPLQKIDSVTVMTVNLYFRTPGLHPAGFGYLIPLATPLEQNPEMALGVVFDTSYSSHASAPDPDGMVGPTQDTVSQRGTKLTVMLGGHYWSGWPMYPTEEEGLQMAKSILARHLGITEEPAAYAVNLQQDCIPQYTVGHEDRLRQIHKGLAEGFHGRLRVAGNWARGVGVNDCLRSAWDVVRELRDEGKTGLEPVVEDKTWVRIKPPEKRKTRQE